MTVETTGETPRSVRGGDPIRVLVVDDHALFRRGLEMVLAQESDIEVVGEAGDAVAAVDRSAELLPDVVLLDVEMPRMDGYQVCKLVRNSPATKDVPVVMISGKDGFFDKTRGRMAGATGYITKPFGPETLMKSVELYLSGGVQEME